MHEWQCEWPSCAPFFSARSEMNFHARKSKLDFSVIAEVVGSNAPGGRLSNNTLHLSARRIVKTSGWAQLRQSCSNRIHMPQTFPYILFFFLCLVIVSSVRHIPQGAVTQQVRGRMGRLWEITWPRFLFPFKVWWDGTVKAERLQEPKTPTEN